MMRPARHGGVTCRSPVRIAPSSGRRGAVRRFAPLSGANRAILRPTRRGATFRAAHRCESRHLAAGAVPVGTFAPLTVRIAPSCGRRPAKGPHFPRDATRPITVEQPTAWRRAKIRQRAATRHCRPCARRAYRHDRGREDALRRRERRRRRRHRGGGGEDPLRLRASHNRGALAQVGEEGARLGRSRTGHTRDRRRPLGAQPANRISVRRPSPSPRPDSAPSAWPPPSSWRALPAAMPAVTAPPSRPAGRRRNHASRPLRRCGCTGPP